MTAPDRIWVLHTSKINWNETRPSIYTKLQGWADDEPNLFAYIRKDAFPVEEIRSTLHKLEWLDNTGSPGLGTAITNVRRHPGTTRGGRAGMSEFTDRLQKLPKADASTYRRVIVEHMMTIEVLKAELLVANNEVARNEGYAKRAEALADSRAGRIEELERELEAEKRCREAAEKVLWLSAWEHDCNGYYRRRMINGWDSHPGILESRWTTEPPEDVVKYCASLGEQG